MTQDKFYLQDSRSYVGNDMLFWAKDGNGYTTDLRKAHVYTREQAQSIHDLRESDIPWPKAYIDGKTRPACDMQYVNLKEALADSGITLKKAQKSRNDALRCSGCGIFLSKQAFWGSECRKCGTDNRP